MVAEHNRVRKNVGQAPIIWNDKLAEGAKVHANKCKFAHSTQGERTVNGVMLGENLAQGGPYDMYSEQALFRLWEDEKKDYVYPQGPGDSKTGVTGHYTQIINAKVVEVGCACTKCDNNKFCVCRYNPIQYGGQPPY